MKPKIYKGKSIEGNIWVTGELIERKDDSTKEIRYYLAPKCNKENWDTSEMSYASGFEIEVKKETLCRYVGKKDIYKNMVFLGDILVFNDGHDTSTESGFDWEDFVNYGLVVRGMEIDSWDITNRHMVKVYDIIEQGFVIVGNIIDSDISEIEKIYKEN